MPHSMGDSLIATAEELNVSINVKLYARIVWHALKLVVIISKVCFVTGWHTILVSTRITIIMIVFTGWHTCLGGGGEHEWAEPAATALQVLPAKQ